MPIAVETRVNSRSQQHRHLHDTNIKESSVADSASISGTSGSTPTYSTVGLLWTRAAVVGIIALVTWVTVSYCTQVYYNREAAFHSALECSIQVLRSQEAEFWLLNGTLLGSTRLGRLVLWDADLDIGFLKKVDKDAIAEETESPIGSTIALMTELDVRCFGRAGYVRPGAYNAFLRVWRKCTSRICAEFHETVKDGDMVKASTGASPVTELFPLKPCVVSEVKAQCPNNAAYYLAQAYGKDWLTRPLTKLFK